MARNTLTRCAYLVANIVAHGDLLRATFFFRSKNQQPNQQLLSSFFLSTNRNSSRTIVKQHVGECNEGSYTGIATPANRGTQRGQTMQSSGCKGTREGPCFESTSPPSTRTKFCCPHAAESRSSTKRRRRSSSHGDRGVWRGGFPPANWGQREAGSGESNLLPW